MPVATWGTPVTTWTSDQGVTDVDINRIEGNTQYLYDHTMTTFVEKAVISETQPVPGPDDEGRLLWYKASVNETKLYVNGAFRSISGGATVFNKVRNTVTLAGATATIAHGITGYTAGRDILFVFKGGTWLQETTDFTISGDGLSIVSTGVAWPAGEVFDFLDIQPATSPTQDTLVMYVLESSVTGTAGQTNIPISISGYDPVYDYLEVFLQNLRLNKTEHWTLNANNTSIDLTGFSLNNNEKVQFKVLKKVRDQAPTGSIDGTLLLNGSVTRAKLATDLIPISVSNLLLTTTTATNVATYTPITQGNFEVKVYVRIVTAATNVTITVTYTDDAGVQTYTMQAASSLAIGSHGFLPYFFNAKATGPITVTITAGTANQVYASTSVVAQ